MEDLGVDRFFRNSNAVYSHCWIGISFMKVACFYSMTQSKMEHLAHMSGSMLEEFEAWTLFFSNPLS